MSLQDPEPSDSTTTDDLTPFTCPDCGGSLWLHNEYGVRRYRCRVGHTFSAEGLLLGKREALEAALWAAVVALRPRLPHWSCRPVKWQVPERSTRPIMLPVETPVWMELWIRAKKKNVATNWSCKSPALLSCR